MDAVKEDMHIVGVTEMDADGPLWRPLKAAWEIFQLKNK